MLKRIGPREVRLGMYVHSFEGRWLAHPFWRDNFHVTDPEDLKRVQKSKVKAVVIDEAKALDMTVSGRAIPSWIKTDLVPEALVRISPRAAPRTEPAVVDDTRFVPKHHLPRDADEVPSTEAERAEVIRILARSARTISASFHGVAQGQPLSIDGFADVVDDIATAMTNSRSTMIGLSRLKRKDEYTYFHSVAVGALMLGLARELGLDEHVVRDLTLGGLLHDVGKMKIADAILNKPGALSEAEFAEMKRHPALGHDILRQDGSFSPIVLEVTLRHHERLDGRGYPDGLAGDEVSLYARISGICDVFDALTSARVYKDAMPAYEAIAMMLSWEGQFDRDLLLVFMRSIGLYPAGLLVRLSSQRLGITLPPGRHAGRPRARVFHCAASDTPLPPCDVVISESKQGEQVVAEELPENWSIDDWPEMRKRLSGTT